MAINKKKNVSIQVTFPKDVAEQLETLKKAFNNNGIRVSKSDILVRAFKDYLTILVATNADNKEDTKEAKEDKEDA